MVGRRVCSALLAQALVEGAEAPQLGVTACFGDVFDHATNQLVPITYAACCVRNESCGFDDRFFSRSECCATGTVVLNPYAFTSPPTVVVPKPEAWPAREWPAKNHPSFAPEQRAWEAAINDAVRIRDYRLRVGVEEVRTVPVVEFKDRSGLFLDGNTLPIHMAGAARAARGQLDPDIELDLDGVAGAVAFEALRTGLLLSIEPDPLDCRLLTWNLRRLGLTKRVWPLCAGIRELSGPRAKQYWPVYTCACNTHWHSGQIVHTSQRYRISCRMRWCIRTRAGMLHSSRYPR